MFKTTSYEPSLPDTIHLRRETVPVKHLDTTTLVNNTSAFTFEPFPLETTSTRVSSTIMAGSETAIQDNAMSKAHQAITIQNRVPVKAIRIERDYSLGDGITRFSTEYPVELTGKV
ncbi:hypothetical protein CU098_009906, partial [Rhizopus stolonifer]